MHPKSLLSSALVGFLAIVPLATAHTWVEQLMVIAPNGTLIGQPGFPRGNVLRSNPGFGDPAMVNLIPPDGRPFNQINPQDLMCRPSQTSQSQTDGSPRLQAGPGSAIALRYQENGHVSLPDAQPGKPQNRGTVYVYGTTQPSPDDSFLAIHRVWTPDGTGGDGRGVLLSTRNFDDGQCYQTNGGPISAQRQRQFGHPFSGLMGNDLWCQQDIQLPTSTPSGKPYTLYWVWDWPTLPGTPGFPEGKQELYTTCMDIDIVDTLAIESVSKFQGSSYQDQPLDQAAIRAQMADIANPTAVTGTTIAFTASATGPVSGAASQASISFATQDTTGVPDFLTIHTGSTAGPGIETQTFTVQPIAETAAPGQQPQGGRDGGGRGGNRGEPSTYEVANPNGVDVKLIIHAGGTGPRITSVPAVNNQAGVLTLTEYDSVTETVYQTVYQTLYTKRDAGESYTLMSFSQPIPRIEPHVASQTTQDGSQATPLAGQAEDHAFVGSCVGNPVSCGPSNLPSSESPDGQGSGTPTISSDSTVTTDLGAATLHARQATQTSIVPTLDVHSLGSRAVKPTGQSDRSSDAAGALAVIPDVNTNTAANNAPGGPSQPHPTGLSTQYLTRPTFKSNLLTTSSTDAQVTTAPSIGIRAAEPDLTSTAHAAFRLRARNPFVWLGWKQDNTIEDAEATPTIHF